jgi:hypothetical protein
MSSALLLKAVVAGKAGVDFGWVRARLCEATRLLNPDFAEQKPFEKPF